MNKKYFLLFAILAIWTTGVSGKKKEIPLKGTKWKLVGIVDNETGNLKELRPKECEECYTLTFDTDFTARGLSVSSKVYINLKKTPCDIIQGGSEIFDGDIFYVAMCGVRNYCITSKKMKLYSYDCYLLFKRI